MNSFWGFIQHTSPDGIRAFCGVFQKCPIWQTERFTGFSGLQPSLLHDPPDRLVKGGVTISRGWDSRSRYERGGHWWTGYRPGNFFYFFLRARFKKNLWHWMVYFTHKKIFPVFPIRICIKKQSETVTSHFSFPMSNPTILWTKHHCDNGRARWDFCDSWCGWRWAYRTQEGVIIFLTCVVRRATCIGNKNAGEHFHNKIVLIKVTISL